jgi:hypothetical protein
MDGRSASYAGALTCPFIPNIKKPYLLKDRAFLILVPTASSKLG